ncbi:hypothetical protein ACIHFD_58605 [Nonomuraea sp. NPDC051941]|uniref:hypothetical protein n=1 Tax=Nonomuraea sp. NPDC051941 TaxID=3364373 RepID=UPI0037C9E504
MVISFVVAGLIGALVALAELVSRYRDDPWRALVSLPAGLYVVVNLAGSVSGLWMIKQFGLTFGAAGAGLELTQVLVAGFGSSTLFRSSLFNVTVGNQVVGVGPSAVLTVLLSAADRAVDRGQAKIRSEQVRRIMDKYPFERGADALFQYSAATLQNFTPTETKAIEDRISSLRSGRESTLPDQVKSYLLGLALQTLVGEKTLRELVESLRPIIEQPPPAEQVLLDTLEAVGRSELRSLQARSGLPLYEFSRVLDALASAGRVSIDGDPGKETVSPANATA